MVFAKGNHSVSEKRSSHTQTHTHNKVIKINELWVIQISIFLFLWYLKL